MDHQHSFVLVCTIDYSMICMSVRVYIQEKVLRRPGTLTNGGDKKILNKFGGSSITVDRHPAISNSHKYTTHHPAHILVHRGSILPNLTTPHQPFNTPHHPAHILVHRGSILPNLTSPHQPYYIPHHPAHILVHRGVFYQT